MRGEIVVPIVAVVLLIAALVLGRRVAPPATELTLEPSPVPGGATVIAPSPTLLGPTVGSGYPFGEAGVTPLPGAAGTPTAVLTDTAIALEPSNGYPAPGDGPQPIGPPPTGGFPDVPTPDLSSGYPGPAPTYPTPALIPTAPLPPASGGYTPPPSFNPPASPPRQPPTVPAAPGAPPSGYPPPAEESPPAATTPPDAIPTVPGASTAGPATPPAEGTMPAPTDAVPTAAPSPTPVPPTATPRTGKLLTGTVRWSIADSPVRLTEDHAVAAGASLTIDPGVEVYLAPGVRLTVAGTLRAQGTAGAPVRFLGPDGRWDAIVGVDGSVIALDQVEIRQAGAAGVAISSSNGALALRNARLSENGGGILVVGSQLDLRGTQIVGNVLAAPALNVQLPPGGTTTISGNLLRDNTLPAGTPQVRLAAGETTGALTIEGNLIHGDAGAGLLIDTRAALSGAIRCNAFVGGTIGLHLAAQRPDLRGFDLSINANSFTGQTRYGVAGTLPFNVSNNWWGDASGPFEAQRNPQGRGVPVGVNLEFQPWLTQRPACAPAS